jgi:hypothetical protein
MVCFRGIIVFFHYHLAPRLCFVFLATLQVTDGFSTRTSLGTPFCAIDPPKTQERMGGQHVMGVAEGAGGWEQASRVPGKRVPSSKLIFSFSDRCRTIASCQLSLVSSIHACLLSSELPCRFSMPSVRWMDCAQSLFRLSVVARRVQCAGRTEKTLKMFRVFFLLCVRGCFRSCSVCFRRWGFSIALQIQ